MRTVTRLAPGIVLSGIIGLAAWWLQQVETRAIGHPLIEALVLAILLGTAVRTAWSPSARWTPGIRFTAKELLELAVLLLGASIDLPVLLKAGPALMIGIVGVVVLGISASYTIGRSLGLHHRLAMLVACGNSICGNSAIAAVAPVIGADGEDVASSIAFTAILGVIVVLSLPGLMYLLGLSQYQYGVLAGLSIYAVPQVIAATFPVSALSGQVGTLVKLVRVLMLGPVVLVLGLGHGRKAAESGRARPGLSKLVPWFIVGFLVLAAVRSFGALPSAVADPVKGVSTWLTIASMAALGLGVDIRVLGRVGGRVTTAVTASLAVLIVVSLALIRVLHLS